MKRFARNLLRFLDDTSLYYERMRTAERLRGYRRARDRYKLNGDIGFSEFNAALARNYRDWFPMRKHARLPF